ncbi:hypothetical protein [Streptosporangium lutulentum]|uniref:Preprotein translocase subunit SecB n=1 Tax=Streptosporangium lutulentum TaxID=1461250 RepID=A0ABT9QPI8_9ACTN|nr:hypothetical protein [Streptosporangium lutulentum]MDP9848681.1 preprotein translocase subunit SecB [Streptosporangium lutulentum]
MSAEGNARKLTAEELESVLELRQIYFFEISSRRWGSNPGSAEVAPEADEHNLQVMNKLEKERLSVRARMEIKTTQAQIIVDVAAIFSLEEGGLFLSAEEDGPDEPSESDVFLEEETLKQFMEEVGVPALFPFIRESVHSAARRIGVKAPIIGLLKPGGVTLKANALKHDLDSLS